MMFKKTGLSVVVAIALVSAFMAIATSEQAIAAIGCCKYRDNANYGWRVIHTDLALCQDQNVKEDKGDNIFEAIGNYWWDTRC